MIVASRSNCMKGCGCAPCPAEIGTPAVALLPIRQRTPIPRCIRRQRETTRDPLVTSCHQLRSPPIRRRIRHTSSCSGPSSIPSRSTGEWSDCELRTGCWRRCGDAPFDGMRLSLQGGYRDHPALIASGADLFSLRRSRLFSMICSSTELHHCQFPPHIISQASLKGLCIHCHLHVSTNNPEH